MAVALALLVGLGGFLVHRSGEQRRSEHDVSAADLTGRPGGATATSRGSRASGGTGARRPHAKPPTMTLGFAGDVNLEGEAGVAFRANALTLLAGVRRWLERPDFTMVNVDTAIRDRGSPVAGKAVTWGAPKELFPVLKFSGVDAVTMANRHGLDYGRSALARALDIGREANLPVLGAGLSDTDAFAPFRTVVRGRRLAVLAATQVFDAGFAELWKAGPDRSSGSGSTSLRSVGMAFTDPPDRLLAAVRRVRPTADLVVVYLAWGDEGSVCPSAAQKTLAGQLVEAGADVVVGSGAHRLQGAGHLRSGSGSGARRGFVSFGLGNFVFSNLTADPPVSGVLELSVSGRAVTAARLEPFRLDKGRPVPLEAEQADRTRQVVRNLRRCAGLEP